LSFPYAGKPIEDVFGFSKKELEEDASLIRKYYHPDDANRIAETINVSAENLTPWKCEFRYFHPIKGEIWLEGNSVPKKESDESIIWYGVIIDTTIRKKSEQLLKDFNFRFELITRSTNEALWEWNFETGIFWGNEAYQKLFGLTIKDPVAGIDRWIQKIHPNDRHIIADSQTHSLSSDKNIFITEYRFLNSNNDYINIYDRCYILRNDKGAPIRILGSMMDNTEQKKYEKEIKLINSELRELSAHLQTIREEERLQIARDIHDELGQQLTGLKLGVEWLNLKIVSQDILLKDKTTEMIELIKAVINSVKRISSDLRPSMIDDLGIVAALEWQSIEVQKRFGIKIHFNSSMDEPNLPIDTSTALFRIYQETLTNVIKHADANEVKSSLQLIGNNIILEIKDNGIGMKTSINKKQKSFGLIGIKERSFAIGGKFDLYSEAGKGTTIKITVPI